MVSTLWSILLVLTHLSRFSARTHPIEAVLYGDLYIFAYYYVDLLIGDPIQRVSAIVDTGSTLGAFACSECSHCGSHLDLNFNFLASASSRWLTCGHTQRPREERANFQCGQCREGRCGYEQSYREGSSLSGNFFSDLVRIGNPENPPVRATMGCHTDERKLFFSQKANGILGLAPHRTGKTETMLEIIFGNFPKIFAICLSHEGGHMTVGETNRKFHRKDIVWTDMIIGNYYGLKLDKISVDNENAGSSFGSVIVDSGTTFTYLPPAIYRSIKSAIAGKCAAGVYRCARKIDDNCWTDADDFPSINFHLPASHTVRWQAKHGYLYLKGGHWCYAFEDALALETVLGASFMIGLDVIFDVGNSKIGFAPADCPVVAHRDEFSPLTPTSSSTTTITTSMATTTTSTTARTSGAPSASTAADPMETPAEAKSEETVDLPTGSVSLVLIFAGVVATAAIFRFRRGRAAELLERSSLTTTVGVALDDRDLWLQPVGPLQ